MLIFEFSYAWLVKLYGRWAVMCKIVRAHNCKISVGLRPTLVLPWWGISD